MSIENQFNNPPQEAPEREEKHHWSKEQIDDGVKLARSLSEQRYLSKGEVNAIVDAYNRFKEGKSSKRDILLLTEWADKADCAREQEQNDAELRQRVIKEVGRDLLMMAEDISRALGECVKRHLLEDPNRAGEVGRLWQYLVNTVFTRLTSENLRDSKKVETALELATALLQAEPTREGKDAAKKGIEALKKRYGI